MADDQTERSPIDRSRVITTDSWKLRYWCGRFVCTEEQLREAVDRVGVGVAKVEQYLNARIGPRLETRGSRDNTPNTNRARSASFR